MICHIYLWYTLYYMLDQKATQLIKRIIRTYLPDTSYKTFIFGSRATGTNRTFSDIDLGIEGPKSLTPQEYMCIQNALEDSDIPYRVDLVDFKNASEEFRKISTHTIVEI